MFHLNDCIFSLDVFFLLYDQRIIRICSFLTHSLSLTSKIVAFFVCDCSQKGCYKSQTAAFWVSEADKFRLPLELFIRNPAN